MKLSIERAALLKSLGHAQSVVERRTTIPILGNVRLDADGDRLRLTATDLDIAMSTSVPAKVERKGQATAPAHTLYDIARKLPDGAEVELTYEAADQRLRLRAGKSSFNLPCLPVEDFPVMAEGELPVAFSLPAAALKRMIDKTKFAISTEETRYYLNGIYFHATGQASPKLRAVATDGHRLARVESPLPEGAASMPGVIVPRKTVQELRRLLDETDSEVQVTLSDSKIRFGFDGAVLTSKLIDGTFPDYERVIPSGNDKRLEVDTRSFNDAVDRVSTIATDKSRAVKIEVGAGRVVVSASSPEHGTATEEIPVEFTGKGLEIGFNSRYLLDVGGQVQGGHLVFELNDSTSPSLVRDSGDDGALYVLMPMRV